MYKTYLLFFDGSEICSNCPFDLVKEETGVNPAIRIELASMVTCIIYIFNVGGKKLKNGGFFNLQIIKKSNEEFCRINKSAFTIPSTTTKSIYSPLQERSRINMVLRAGLLTAKSRVAPLKQTTLPRLELCGALLAVQLTERVKTDMDLKIDNVYYWTDSEGPQIGGKQLESCTLWWSGPIWLREEINFQTIRRNGTIDNIPEQRVIIHLATYDNFIAFERFSSITRLQRSFSYVLRFIFNLKAKFKNLPKATGPLTEAFPQAYDQLLTKGHLHKKSQLLSLSPFTDKNKIIRGGGRIQMSNCDHDKKHSIILPQKHKITILLLQQLHVKLLHCGPTMLLASIREQFWPLGGRNLCRSVMHKCVKCFTANPLNLANNIMANLPSYRITQYLPFVNSG
ncbi:hypothetical protein PPYR_00120 [Photinus pyralis]|uniref:Uncharacterized protein n=1 Tax=Photinus pyralis TaxID=7054 RepID=A0A5N4B176_PHOPY|nr:hypothetical protein PPYR_00120 [Photinus pyralis]